MQDKREPGLVKTNCQTILANIYWAPVMPLTCVLKFDIKSYRFLKISSYNYSQPHSANEEIRAQKR